MLDLAWVGRAEVDPALELPDGTQLLRARVRVEKGLRPAEIVPAVLGPGTVALAAARIGLLGEDLSRPLGGIDLAPSAAARPPARRLPMAGVPAAV